jgi:hypothetical protein
MTRALHTFSAAAASVRTISSAKTPARASMAGDPRIGVRQRTNCDALATRCALH